MTYVEAYYGTCTMHTSKVSGNPR